MSVRKGFMVVSAMFEYDDNYYSESVGATFHKHVYRAMDGEDGAAAACLRANMAHAREVAGNIHEWLRDDSLGDYAYPNSSDGPHDDPDLRVLRRVYSIFCPRRGDAETAPIEQIIRRLNRVQSARDISDEDAQFLCENLGLFCDSHVEEVIVEDWPVPQSTEKP